MMSEVYGFNIGQFLRMKFGLLFATKGSGEAKIASVGFTFIVQSNSVIICFSRTDDCMLRLCDRLR